MRVCSSINMRPCAREQLRPKFPDAVEREVRRCAVERLQLEAVLHCRREDLLAGADSFHLLRSRKAASEKTEAHVQADVRDSADIAMYFAAQITNRTERKRTSNGYVPGIPSSGTRAVGLHRAQPLTVAIGPRPPHHLKCLCVDSQDAPLPPTARSSCDVIVISHQLTRIHAYTCASSFR